MTSTITIRLDKDIKDRLDALAGVTDRSKSWLAAQAIRDFVEVNEWQLGEIQSAIKEADAGEFATAADVAAFKARWTRDAG